MRNFGGDIREGMNVCTADGKKLGKVKSIAGDEFIIEKGLLFKQDYTAKSNRIVDIRGDELVYEPVGAEEPTAAAGTVGGGASETRMPLAEEQLDVTKQAQQKGGVRVTKEIITEEKQVTVPVTREEISVERVPASQQAASSTRFEEGQITVPAMEEEVTVSKRPVVREEIRVRKQPVQEQRSASAEVRREEAHVEELPETERRTSGETEPSGGMTAPSRDDDVKR
jgi:uncharacterized protein (TIGR02271 family)